MRTGQAEKAAKAAAGAEAGFTLIELMTSTAVLLVMLGMAFSLLSQGQSVFMAQNASARAQARARKAINLMAAEINLAGAAPVTITAGAPPGLQPVGGSVTASSTALRVVADRDGSGTTNGTGPGGDGDINDDLTYSFSNGTIFRTAPNDPDYQSNGAAVARPLIDGVNSLTITYFNAAGTQLSAPINLAAVRSVRLTIVTAVTQLGNQTGTVTVEATVVLRNLQLDAY
jgi:prepilin-type N-terminal cleavage/methylation domain-containing protein